MTEERFEDLVNLYLDNEIGRHDLHELKGAIKANGVLRRRFERSCQLHQAARKALTDRLEGKTPDDRGPVAGERRGVSGAAPSRDFDYSHLHQQSAAAKRHSRHNDAVPSVIERRETGGGVVAGIDRRDTRRNKSISAHVSGHDVNESLGNKVNPLVGILASTLILVLATLYVINFTGVKDESDNRFTPDGKYNPKLTAEDEKFNLASVGLAPDGRPLDASDGGGNISTSVFATTMASDGSVTQIVQRAVHSAGSGPVATTGIGEIANLPVATETVSVNVAVPDSIQWSAARQPPPLLSMGMSYQSSSLPSLPAMPDAGKNAGATAPADANPAKQQP